MSLGKAKLHGRSVRLFRSSERWQKKWLTYIFALFAVPRDLESAARVIGREDKEYYRKLITRKYRIQKKKGIT
jgi:hypothetical protein